MQFSYFYGGIDNHELLIRDLVNWKIQFITLNHRQCDLLLRSSHRELERIKNDFHTAGVMMRALHAPFGLDNNLSDADSERRLRTLNEHKEIVRRMPIIGIEILHIHPGASSNSEDKSISRDQERGLLLESLDELLRVAEESGVRLAVENMPRGFGSPEELLSIIQSYKSPYLGACYDTGHAHVSSGVIHGMTTLGSKIIDFHIHDNNGIQDNHLQPPYGTIDWEAFIAKTIEIGFADPLTMECLSWGNAGLERMAREVEAFFSGNIATCKVGEREGIVKCSKCKHIFVKSAEEFNCLCDN